MWLTVEHVTRLSYDGPINEAYSELRLKPAHRDGQRCSSFLLTTEPRGIAVAEYRDRFGNTVHHFDVLESHQTLGVTARSEVWTPDQLRARRRDGAVAARSLGSAPREPVRAARRRDCRAGGGVDRAAGRRSRRRTGGDGGRPRAHDLRDRLDARAHARRRGALGRARRLSGLRARDDRRLPAARDPVALRQRLPVRPEGDGQRQLGVARLGRRLGSRIAAGSRSIRPTIASRRPATCGSAWGATTQTCHRRAASTRGRRRKSSRSRFASASRRNPLDQSGHRREGRRSPRRSSSGARSGSPISFEIARISTAGTPASAAARSTPKPSIASTHRSEPPPPTAALVPIGRTRASGSASRAAATSRGSAGTRSTSAIAAARSQ